MKTLLSWVGYTDINSAKENKKEDLGPLGQALSLEDFERVVLLTDAADEDRDAVESYLSNQGNSEPDIVLQIVKFESPIDFHEIYPIANKALADLMKRELIDDITIHFSPGTAVMQSIWMLLAARKGVRLIQTSKQQGLQDAGLPFDIHAEFDFIKSQSTNVTRAIVGSTASKSGFDGIFYESQAMAKVVQKAKKFAHTDMSLLIEGESGTGKELFARAVHEQSSRAGGGFEIINCGGIAESLVDSELFGYEKGAFTGAEKSVPGIFETTKGGTVFLDEVGELTPSAQTRLLRVMPPINMVRPVGPGSKERPIDVRIVSATNRDLVKEVRDGNFREDLYFRLAATSIWLPALRDREDDIIYLIDRLFEQKCIELKQTKSLSSESRALLEAHSWPGNVRELEWTLARAIVLAEGRVISGADVNEAIITLPTKKTDLLHQPLGGDFKIDEVLVKIEADYTQRALGQTNNNQSRAAELLGLSQQNLSSRMRNKLAPYLQKIT